MKQRPEKSNKGSKGVISKEFDPFDVAAEKNKHAGGRPPKYTTPEEMQSVIDEYFASCWVKRPLVGLTQIRPYTIAGLALALDLTRQGLCEYSDKDEFSDVVKKAKLKVEMNVEETLLEKGHSGSIFWLKNHAAYTDKREVEHSGKLTLEDILGGCNE